MSGPYASAAVCFPTSTDHITMTVRTTSITTWKLYLIFTNSVHHKLSLWFTDAPFKNSGSFATSLKFVLIFLLKSYIFHFPQIYFLSASRNIPVQSLSQSFPARWSFFGVNDWYFSTWRLPDCVLIFLSHLKTFTAFGPSRDSLGFPSFSLCHKSNLICCLKLQFKRGKIILIVQQFSRYNISFVKWSCKKKKYNVQFHLQGINKFITQ